MYEHRTIGEYAKAGRDLFVVTSLYELRDLEQTVVINTTSDYQFVKSKKERGIFFRKGDIGSLEEIGNDYQLKAYFLSQLKRWKAVKEHKIKSSMDFIRTLED